SIQNYFQLKEDLNSTAAAPPQLLSSPSGRKEEGEPRFELEGRPAYLGAFCLSLLGALRLPPQFSCGEASFPPPPLTPKWNSSLPLLLPFYPFLSCLSLFFTLFSSEIRPIRVAEFRSVASGGSIDGSTDSDLWRACRDLPVYGRRREGGPAAGEDGRRRRRRVRCGRGGRGRG
uniref:Uncharacterized protein n=1 Tax=Aegilops tauschii subsp. strangulata TaxID=200361 RepID=A0A453ALA0_AEGTS